MDGVTASGPGAALAGSQLVPGERAERNEDDVEWRTDHAADHAACAGADERAHKAKSGPAPADPARAAMALTEVLPAAGTRRHSTENTRSVVLHWRHPIHVLTLRVL